MELYLFWNMITGSQRIIFQAYFMMKLIQSQGSMKLEQNGWYTGNILKKIIKGLNFKPTVDLFATRVNTQLPQFILVRPDPETKGVNAFTLWWENLSFHAFPPFICISKVLQKVWYGKAEGILVVPDWPNQQ